MGLYVEFNIHTRVYQKFPDWADNEINNNNKHWFRSTTKGYGGKTHSNDSQNTDKTAPSGRELYHLQFSLKGASPESFGYTLVNGKIRTWILLLYMFTILSLNYRKHSLFAHSEIHCVLPMTVKLTTVSLSAVVVPNNESRERTEPQKQLQTISKMKNGIHISRNRSFKVTVFFSAIKTI
jgi:hypothetical protein